MQQRIKRERSSIPEPASAPEASAAENSAADTGSVWAVKAVPRETGRDYADDDEYDEGGYARLISLHRGERNACLKAAEMNMVDWLCVWSAHRHRWTSEEIARDEHLAHHKALYERVTSFFAEEEEDVPHKRRRALARCLRNGIDIDFAALSLGEIKSLNKYFIDSLEDQPVSVCSDIGGLKYTMEEEKVKN